MVRIIFSSRERTAAARLARGRLEAGVRRTATLLAAPTIVFLAVFALEPARAQTVGGRPKPDIATQRRLLDADPRFQLLRARQLDKPIVRASAKRSSYLQQSISRQSLERGKKKAAKPASPRAPTAQPEACRTDLDRTTDAVCPIKDRKEQSFVVALMDAQDRFHCSGVLVDRTHVLTARHCACSRAAGGTLRPLAYAAFGIDAFAPTARRRLVRVIFPGATACPADPETVPEEGDFALYTLESEAPASAETAVLAPASWAGIARDISAVGYGVQDDGTIGRRVRVDNIDVISNMCDQETVSSADASGDELIPDWFRLRCLPGREMVAADKLLLDTCSGDSGGALLLHFESLRRLANLQVPDKVRTPKFLVVGLISRALIDAPRSVSNRRGSCGLGGIYPLIDPTILAWLRANEVKFVTTYEGDRANVPREGKNTK